MAQEDTLPLIRALGEQDRTSLDRLLVAHAETTMILRSNLLRGGLGAYGGAQYQCAYAGAFEDGQLVAVAAHSWLDSIVLCGGRRGDLAGPVAAAAAALSGRSVKGILGRHAEVVDARAALGLKDVVARYASREILFSLLLRDVALPPALSTGRLTARTPRDDELGWLLEWRMAYAAETMSTPDTPATRRAQADYLAMLHEERRDTLLVDETGRPVSYSAFNAALPDIVQIGGVWTPKELRGRGYARCAVAASLQNARTSGVERAVLFTAEENVAAQACYASIGFREIGDYGLAFFA